MCGITGSVWRNDSGKIDEETLHRMADAISHRGPDDRTFLHRQGHQDAYGRALGVALGFRRLSIIDLEGARQPLTDEKEQIQVIFNGEIYNFSSLRRRLEGRGHRFRTDGDGECIVHAYQDDGIKAFASLVGMFAIAIWDPTRHQLVLARDRIGQKPLFYSANQDRIVFGSELKCLAEVKGVCNEVDPAAVDEFLTYQYVPHPGTIWKDVRALPPGHVLIYKDGQTEVKPYWDFQPSIEQPIGTKDAIDSVRELLDESVRLRMQSDVPLGSFLSGGIDSSIVTALASRHSKDPVRTFSIGFPVSDFDETQYAAQVAEHLGTEHQRFEVQPDAVEIIDKLVWHYDQPFGDSSAVPTYYLSELTRKHVTVALSGDGGDELFAGYDRYRALWLSQKLRRWFPIHRVPGIRLIDRLPDSNRRRSIIRRGKRFLEAIGQPAARRYLNWLQIFPESMRASLYQDEFVERLPDSDPFDFLESVWERSHGRDDVTRASMADILSYLPCDLCTKVDIASMAHSLEVRQPMLDHRLVEFAARLPVHHKFRGKRGKLILAEAFGDMVPKSIFTRSKMGFGIPISNWFRNELKPMVQQTLVADDARMFEYFRPESVRQLVNDHADGRANHGYRIWNLLIFEKWLRRWT